MSHSRGGRHLVSLPWPLFLALRYLRSARKDAFVSFLSSVAIGGIALGVAALIVALAGLSGLQRALREEVLSRTAEIEVEAPARELTEIAATIRAMEGVRTAHRRVRGAGWVLVDGSVRPVEIQGYEGNPPIEWVGEAELPIGLYVSERLAQLYGLEVGERIELASARPTLSPVGPVPRVRRVPLAGLFAAGAMEQREMVALPLAEAVGLLGSGSMHLVVSTGDLDRALRVAGTIQRVLPEVNVRTWEQLNGPLLFALELEKRLMFVAVFLIVLVGALALVSSISLVISSRRSEIAILGTLGARPGALKRAFLALGGMLGGVGILVGVVLGVGTSALLDRFEVVRLPSDAYLLEYVPFLIEGGDLMSILGATLAVSVGCAWYGASQISGLRPVEVLTS
jgi:lipoprotein-releasing system permease protein